MTARRVKIAAAFVGACILAGALFGASAAAAWRLIASDIEEELP